MGSRAPAGSETSEHSVDLVCSLTPGQAAFRALPIQRFVQSEAIEPASHFPLLIKRISTPLPPRERTRIERSRCSLSEAAGRGIAANR
jgi:hypothetical protein